MAFGHYVDTWENMAFGHYVDTWENMAFGHYADTWENMAFGHYGQGRIEKTEIVEMAIKHITSLQMQVKQVESKGLPAPSMELKESFYHGFQMCKSEIIKFLTEIEGVSHNNPFNLRLCEHLNMRKSQIFDEEMSKYQDFQHQNVLQEIKQSRPPEMKASPIQDTAKGTTPPGEKSPESVSSDCSVFPPMKVDSDNNLTMKRIMSGLDSYSDSGVSIQNSTNGSTTGNQTSSDDNAEEQQNGGKSCYKFKHIIRHRYSRDKGSDSSSVSSGSSDGRPSRSHKNNSSNNVNNGGQSCVQSSNLRMDENESIGLPGFVIHPTHTHYVPISVHQSFLPDLFETESNNYCFDGNI
ncbi:hypothetical protein LOTGIDRAFT_160258 [Lottia gigantea]|uniref:Orange domain-containing protein n=1 Tax=Lottia gigantea TaxID=225164 RepID=V4APY2_LOTGI|nr:hypothetical protein LOTGIDRAFT_160258 [Lottia gigantea]ESO95706.1 hypothetical protein LOTGIDRAFT_160258 [Lottia gigantea]